MNYQSVQHAFLALTLTLLAACGGSSSSSSDSNFKASNACAPAEDAEMQTSFSAAAVPPDGAAIAIEPAFPELTFERPLNMQQAPDDDQCWFVVEQPGRVFSFANDDATRDKFTFIDISERVDNTFNEAGLLGMAFHPDFKRNGEVFLSYTGDDDGLTSYISRFRSLDDGKTLDPDTEEIVLTMQQPFPNHNGGNIAFGPDGYLYIGFGDGGSANDPNENGQNTLNLYSTMVRIDVDGGNPYAIPEDNPFAGNALCDQGFGAADCPEIYAWGLRNPWRWSFDSETGELWLGDVGQSALEEIDIIDIGGNYGWPFYEGTRCNTQAPVVDCDFVSLPPVTEYPRATGRSVTGGYVYRGSNIPDLVGVYVYADFAEGTVFQYFDAGSDEPIEAQLDTELRISTFGQSNDGELYIVDLRGGKLYALIAAE